MDGLSQILDAILKAKTPLTLCGIIAAVVIAVIWQVAKRSTLSDKTTNIIVIGGFSLAGLALVLGVAGFLWPPATVAPPPAPPPMSDRVALIGTVYGDDNDTTGVSQASVVIEPDVDLRRQTLTTDSNGDFEASFSGVNGVIPAEMWASANGYQRSTRQTITLDPTRLHADRIRITLHSASTPPVTSTTPQVTLTTAPAGSTNPAPAPVATSWKALHASAQGNELKLANAASDAFAQGNFAVSAQFLSEAGKVSKGGVWKTSYPKLAASYYLTGKPDLGKATLDKMIADIKHDVNQGGYLGSQTTIGFVLQDLSDARAKVGDGAKPDFDKAIDEVTALKNDAPQRLSGRQSFFKNLKAIHP